MQINNLIYVFSIYIGTFASLQLYGEDMYINNDSSALLEAKRVEKKIQEDYLEQKRIEDYHVQKKLEEERINARRLEQKRLDNYNQKK